MVGIGQPKGMSDEPALQPIDLILVNKACSSDWRHNTGSVLKRDALHRRLIIMLSKRNQMLCNFYYLSQSRLCECVHVKVLPAGVRAPSCTPPAQPGIILCRTSGMHMQRNTCRTAQSLTCLYQPRALDPYLFTLISYLFIFLPVRPPRKHISQQLTR